MKQKIILFFCMLTLSASNVLALDLAGGASLGPGKYRLTVGGGILFGAVSPLATFTHTGLINRAQLFEERVSFARGFGEGWLKEMYLEVEGKVYQSREETIGAITIHARDNGGALLMRGGGNFIHKTKLTFGTWLQAGVPLLMNKDKFVNPVIDYFGGGLNLTYHFVPTLALSQTAYVGSGLFAPLRRNVHLQESTLGNVNLGKWLWHHDLTIKTGAVVEADITSRTDADYQASVLGDGRIRNFLFITPFLIDIPFAETWRLEGGYAVKWAGKSIRGSQFLTANISKIF